MLRSRVERWSAVAALLALSVASCESDRANGSAPDGGVAPDGAAGQDAGSSGPDAQPGDAATTSDGAASTEYGLEWPGNGASRRMLYWHNPFPIYDATYVFKVYPRKKTSGPTGYYTTFFWGNDGTFIWQSGNANT